MLVGLLVKVFVCKYLSVERFQEICYADICNETSFSKPRNFDIELELVEPTSLYLSYYFWPGLAIS